MGLVAADIWSSINELGQIQVFLASQAHWMLHDCLRLAERALEPRQLSGWRRRTRLCVVEIEEP